MGAPGLAASAGLRRFAEYLLTPSVDGAELLLVVAHPDDEAVGFGGQLGRFPRTTILHLTDGAPRDLRDAAAHGFATAEAYAAARREELAAAMRIAGIAPAAMLSWAIPDQGAARDLAGLARRLAALFEARRPRFVLTHPYEGGHPDHDAAAFAVHAALELLVRRGAPAPDVIEMAFYHAGPAGPLYQCFAPPPTPEIAAELADAALAAKRRMFAAHRSQGATLAAFTAPVERFRVGPLYDFRELPNGGRLQYEAWRLGLGGTEWLALARAALAELEQQA